MPGLRPDAVIKEIDFFFLIKKEILDPSQGERSLIKETDDGQVNNEMQ